MNQLFRHGDVMILTNKDFKIPESIKLKKGNLIHQGTNNAHVISKGEMLVGTDKNKKYIRITKAATVSHVGGSATHDSKPLVKGDYWVEIQTEYSHLEEESRKVVD